MGTVATLSEIPGDLRREAAAVLLTQESTPLSPCAALGGEMMLCAATALAAVALERSAGPSVRARFVAELGSRGLGYLRSTFEDLGWSAALCDKIQIRNDSMPPEDRADSMGSWLMDGPSGFPN